MFRSFILTATFLLFISLISTAQVIRDSAAFTRRHFTDEDGLPQNSVKGIVIDNLGFVWLTTEDGMVRFDGNNFVVYNKQNLKGMQSNRMAYIRTGIDNELYAVTDNEDCIRIKNGTLECDSPHNKAIKELAKQFGKYGSKPAIWAIGLPQWVIFRAQPDTYLIPMGDGRFIQCHKDSVSFLGYGANVVNIPFVQKNFLNFFVVNSKLYYLNDDGSFTQFHPEGARSNVKLKGDILKDPAYRQQRTGLVLFWNISTESMLLYFNRAFYRLREGGPGTLHAELILSGFDIEHKQIISHHYDEQNKRLFLGSAVKGLYVLDKKQFTVLSEKGGEQTSVYYALIPYSRNSVLTAQGTVLGVDDSGRTFIEKKSKERFDRYSIATDNNGSIWIREWFTLYQCGRDLKKIRSWVFGSELSILHAAKNNTLWIGMRRKGLYSMDLNQKDPQPVLVNNIALISYIASEPGGQNIWVGTARGLYYIDVLRNKVSEIKQMKDKYIRSIYVFSSNEVWITTYEDGIYLYLDGKFIAMPHDKGNFLSAAHCIVHDARDYLWITTNKGLFLASRKDLIAYARKEQSYVYYHYYGKENGFNTNEFNGGCEPCGALLANGDIMLPSLDGVVWVDPKQAETDFPDYPLIIDNVELDKRQIPYSDTIRLTQSFDQLKVHLSTIYFGNKKNLQISYALVREDKQPEIWYSVPPDNAISFSALSSGYYKLYVRKINGFGKNNFTQIVTTIIVAHEYYEMLWFRALLVLAAIFLAYFYFRIRLFYIIKSNRLLELRIARRTRKLTHTLRALESSESSLRRQTQMQEMLIAAISHDVKTPMKYLLLASRKMQEFMEQKEYGSLSEFNEGIQETAAHVYGILDNLLRYISIQLKKGAITFEYIDLATLIEEKVATFRNIAATNLTRIQNNIPPSTVLYCSKELLAIVIHNLIDNAVKYTANGQISIGFDPDRKVLTIEDSGTGLDPELSKWLNNVRDQEINVNSLSGHKGMGLIIVKELLFAINASIQVGLRPGGGTWIHIRFAEQHFNGLN